MLYKDKAEKAEMFFDDSPLCFFPGEIKHILENELQIPASKMLLKGWKTGDVDDSVSFYICQLVLICQECLKYSGFNGIVACTRKAQYLQYL